MVGCTAVGAGSAVGACCTYSTTGWPCGVTKPGAAACPLVAPASLRAAGSTMASTTPAPMVTSSEVMRRATLDLAMPATSRPAATRSSPSAVKIISTPLDAGLLGLEHPLVALHDDGVRAV